MDRWITVARGVLYLRPKCVRITDSSDVIVVIDADDNATAFSVRKRNQHFSEIG